MDDISPAVFTDIARASLPFLRQHNGGIGAQFLFVDIGFCGARILVMAQELQLVRIRQRDLDEIRISVGAHDSWPRKRRTFLHLIALGVPVKHAAHRSFLNYHTVNNWINKASERFDLDFYELYKAARAEAVVRRVKKIDASDDWKAHAFLLNGATEEFQPKRPIEQHDEEEDKKHEDKIIMNAHTVRALSDAYDRRRAEREADKAQTE